MRQRMNEYNHFNDMVTQAGSNKPVPVEGVYFNLSMSQKSAFSDNTRRLLPCKELSVPASSIFVACIFRLDKRKKGNDRHARTPSRSTHG
ncbi:hypothetical protein J6590_063499 [Homalodisca vitripennis]|nr:hypothetical protein J6590_063499 [Homalodisca vitripennis]